MLLTQVFGLLFHYPMLKILSLPSPLTVFTAPFMLFYACYIYWDIRPNVQKDQVWNSSGLCFLSRARHRAYSDWFWKDYTSQLASLGQQFFPHFLTLYLCSKVVCMAGVRQQTLCLFTGTPGIVKAWTKPTPQLQCHKTLGPLKLFVT